MTLQPLYFDTITAANFYQCFIESTNAPELIPEGGTIFPDVNKTEGSGFGMAIAEKLADLFKEKIEM